MDGRIRSQETVTLDELASELLAEKIIKSLEKLAIKPQKTKLTIVIKLKDIDFPTGELETTSEGYYN